MATTTSGCYIGWLFREIVKQKNITVSIGPSTVASQVANHALCAAQLHQKDSNYSHGHWKYTSLLLLATPHTSFLSTLPLQRDAASFSSPMFSSRRYRSKELM